MAVDEVVHVIAVRYRFVAATVTVDVIWGVAGALMSRSAIGGVGGCHV